MSKIIATIVYVALVGIAGFIVYLVYMAQPGNPFTSAPTSPPTSASANISPVAVCTAEDWSNNSSGCATPSHLSRSDLQASKLVLHMHDNNQGSAYIEVWDENAGGKALSESGLALNQGGGDWSWNYKDVLKPDLDFNSPRDWVRGHTYEVQVTYGTIFSPGTIIGSTTFAYDG